VKTIDLARVTKLLLPHGHLDHSGGARWFRDPVSFLVRRAGDVFLFSGDTVFHGGRILVSAVHDCDAPAYARTLRRLAALDVYGIYPGHVRGTVRGAQAHLPKAAEPLERLLPPPNLG
jgi:hydroxyacylglutathione hydrolase